MPGWLEGLLPAAVRAWLTPSVLVALGLFGVAAFIASLIGVPWFFTRMPADYFRRPDRDPRLQSGGAMLLRVLRNLLGALLMIVGIVCLVLPGQGLLTLVVGLVLLDFPGKRRLERWLLNRGPVLRGINALRRRAHHPPLEMRDSWLPPAEESSRRAH
jgi:hypothetical protein